MSEWNFGEVILQALNNQKNREAQAACIQDRAQASNADRLAAYVRGTRSVDEYLKQCAIVNPHLQLHYRAQLLKKEAGGADESKNEDEAGAVMRHLARVHDELGHKGWAGVAALPPVLSAWLRAADTRDGA